MILYSSPKNQNSIVLLCWNHAMVDPSKSMELDFNYKVFDYIDKLFTNYSSISSIKYRFCIKIEITIICSQQLVHCTNFRNVNKKLDQQISYPLRSVNEININLPRYLYLIASFSNITSKPFLPCYFFV